MGRFSRSQTPSGASSPTRESAGEHIERASRDFDFRRSKTGLTGRSHAPHIVGGSGRTHAEPEEMEPCLLTEAKRRAGLYATVRIKGPGARKNMMAHYASRAKQEVSSILHLRSNSNGENKGGTSYSHEGEFEERERKGFVQAERDDREAERKDEGSKQKANRQKGAVGTQRPASTEGLASSRSQQSGGRSAATDAAKALKKSASMGTARQSSGKGRGGGGQTVVHAGEEETEIPGSVRNQSGDRDRTTMKEKSTTNKLVMKAAALLRHKPRASSAGTQSLGRYTGQNLMDEFNEYNELEEMLGRVEPEGQNNQTGRRSLSGHGFVQKAQQAVNRFPKRLRSIKKIFSEQAADNDAAQEVEALSMASHSKGHRSDEQQEEDDDDDDEEEGMEMEEELNDLYSSEDDICSSSASKAMVEEAERRAATGSCQGRRRSGGTAFVADSPVSSGGFQGEVQQMVMELDFERFVEDSAAALAASSSKPKKSSMPESRVLVGQTRKSRVSQSTRPEGTNAYPHSFQEGRGVYNENSRYRVSEEAGTYYQRGELSCRPSSNFEDESDMLHFGDEYERQESYEDAEARGHFFPDFSNDSQDDMYSQTPSSRSSYDHGHELTARQNRPQRGGGGGQVSGKTSNQPLVFQRQNGRNANATRHLSALEYLPPARNELPVDHRFSQHGPAGAEFFDDEEEQDLPEHLLRPGPKLRSQTSNCRSLKEELDADNEEEEEDDVFPVNGAESTGMRNGGFYAGKAVVGHRRDESHIWDWSAQDVAKMTAQQKVANDEARDRLTSSSANGGHYGYSNESVPRLSTSESSGPIWPSTASSCKSYDHGDASTFGPPSSRASEDAFFECRHFTPDELALATGDFSDENLLGKGAYGPVYHGYLYGCNVAVKRLKEGSLQGHAAFQNEVDVLSHIRHPHVVLLMGQCVQDYSLVYEYMAGGSLQQRLAPGPNDERAKDRVALTWHDRFRIADEIAGALIYLHGNHPPILHRDLKPDNILLDANGCSKIADVGLACLIPEHMDAVVTHNIKGTFGFIDPEVVSSGRFTVRSDVYSFGLVLLLLFTGAPSVKDIHKLLTRTRQNGVLDLKRAVAALLSRLDKAAGEWPEDLARQALMVAVRCVERNAKMRPDLGNEICPTLMKIALEATDEKHRRSQAMQSIMICPLSGEVMKDPVIAADGVTYERRNIEAWMMQSQNSPSNGMRMPHRHLTENHALSAIIRAQRGGRI